MSNRSDRDPDHGIEIVFGDDVSFVDKRSGDVVHFTREEFDAFQKGAEEGEFDLDQLDGDGEHDGEA